MELKDGAIVALAFSLVLVLLAYFTGSPLFWAAFVVAAALVAGDYLRLALGVRSLKKGLAVSTHLSQQALPPGSTGHYTMKAANDGRYGLKLSLGAVLDDSMVPEPADGKVELRPGEESSLDLKIVPTKCGRFDMGRVKVIASSLLYRDTFFAGSDDPLKVRLVLSKSLIRPSAVLRTYKKSEGIYDSIVEKRSGSDFSGVRDYEAGDSVKHIDWALSARAGDLIVREYEAERVLPTYVLIDLSHLEGGDSGKDFNVNMAMVCINRQLVNGDKLGLVCFSRAGVLYHVKPGMGRDHMTALADVLSRLQSGESEAPARRGPGISVGELYNVGRVFERDGNVKTLTPFIEETMKEFMLNVGSDGFIQAVLTVTRTSKDPCQIKVMTGLSMGLPNLLNGIRLAKYYGHTVTVVVNRQAGLSPERSMDLKAAITKLRAYSVNVITPGHPGAPERLFHGGRINSGRRSLRG